MKRYLSFGGGVNSTALMLLLIDQGIEFEAVYADHGADWPETIEYVRMLNENVHPITMLEARRYGLPLYDYYLAHHMVPLRVARACTRLYKLVPLARYMQPPCEVYLGIDAGEAHRITGIIDGERSGETKLFPLVDEGLDRKACIEVIKAHGLPVPIKSGCFICPFQRRGQWRELRTKHPELYCKAKRLEDTTNAWLMSPKAVEGEAEWTEYLADIERAIKIEESTRTPIYIADAGKPLDVVCQDGQLDLWGERELTPCLCEL